ncbi:MAG: molybdopterin-dependent oxidoreductase [Candidatus Binataceae bacterium]
MNNSRTSGFVTNILTRRKFIGVAGVAIVIAGIAGADSLVRASASAVSTLGGSTPNSHFYITSYASTPAVDPSAWRLSIKGLVANPFELSYAQIKSLPQIDETLTLECIGNPPDGTLIGNARWRGVRLRPLLERARLDRRAVWVVMRAADGYYTGLPVEELLRAENFLPWMMNGVPLPPDHGYPVRIFIPGKYGMKQPKWITELEFLDRPATGYWEARRWSNSAWRKVNSGFFSPHIKGGMMSLFDRSAKVAAPADIYGWALAGPSGIKRVQASFDNGVSWHDARLMSNQSPYIWTVWKYRFAPDTPGKYMVSIRATDGNGVAQPLTDPQTGSEMSGQARMSLEVTAPG